MGLQLGVFSCVAAHTAALSRARVAHWWEAAQGADKGAESVRPQLVLPDAAAQALPQQCHHLAALLSTHCVKVQVPVRPLHRVGILGVRNVSAHGMPLPAIRSAMMWRVEALPCADV